MRFTNLKSQNDQRRYGLHQVWPVQGDDEANKDKTIDIIAIHGLDTESPRTWAAYETEGDKTSRLVHWLQDEDMLPRVIPNARIFTYDWNANTFSNAAVEDIFGHAKTLLLKIDQERGQEAEARSLVFIASCFGGLLLAKALQLASFSHSPYLKILDSTIGVVFLGTPFGGTKSAKPAELRTELAKAMGEETYKGLLEDLSRNDGKLEELVTTFAQIVHHPKTQIPIRCFYERRPTNIANVVLRNINNAALRKIFGKVRHSHRLLVPKESACLDFSVNYGLDVNHSMLNKYRGPNDESFKTVSSCLKELVNNTEDRLITQGITTPSINEHYMVPRNENTKFTGRKNFLKNVERALFDRNAEALQKVQKRCVITGIGGIGKSEICLKLAVTLKNKFWGVFWVDVGNHESAERDCKAIAQLLGLSGSGIEQVRRTLSNRKEPWLLVLDNADNPEVDYSEYLPPFGGAVIITSRNPELKRYSTVGHFDLEGLDENDALHLFFISANLTLDSSTEPQAQALVIEALQCHPLAIIQAGAHIESGEATLEEYLRLFENTDGDEKIIQRRKEALQFFDKQEQSRYRSAYNTFEISAIALERPENSDALCLLEILATLHYSPLSTEFFESAWNNKDKYTKENSAEDDWKALTTWHMERFPTFISLESQEDNKRGLRRAVKKLRSLALVKEASMNGVEHLSIHPLIHSWARDRQVVSSRDSSWVQAGVLIAYSWHAYEFKSFYTQIQAHVQSFLREKVDAMFSRGTEKQIAPILLRCCWWLQRLRADRQLFDLLDRIFTHMKADLEAPSISLLPFHRAMGYSMYCLGNYSSAVSVLQRVLDQYEKGRPQDDYDVLGVQYELASAYLENRHIQQAIKLLETVISIQERTQNEHHPDRLASQHELARAYLEDGQTQQAIKLLETVISIQEQTLDKHHPDRLTSQHVLAKAYLKNGQTQQAIKLLETVVSIREQTLDKHHPHRLTSQHELARSYLWDGKLLEAIKILESVVELKKGRDENDQSRLVSEWVLGHAYKRNGEERKAEKMYGRVYRTVKSSFPEGTPLRAKWEIDFEGIPNHLLKYDENDCDVGDVELDGEGEQG